MSIEPGSWSALRVSLSAPWQACLEEAWEAYRAGSLPIGAVVTGPQGDILARGRNRILETQGEPGLLFGQTLAHAEINALAVLPGQSVIDRTQCHLYTTLEPCPMCMGAFYMSAVRSLHYAARDAWAGSTNLLNTTPYLSYKPIRIFGPETGLLEDALMALMVAFDVARRQETWNPVIAAWEKDSPRGVAYGRRLYETGELEGCREAGQSAPQVVDQLFSALLEESFS